MIKEVKSAIAFLNIYQNWLEESIEIIEKKEAGKNRLSPATHL
jgi:hypothetical protein